MSNEGSIVRGPGGWLCPSDEQAGSYPAFALRTRINGQKMAIAGTSA